MSTGQRQPGGLLHLGSPAPCKGVLGGGGCSTSTPMPAGQALVLLPPAPHAATPLQLGNGTNTLQPARHRCGTGCTSGARDLTPKVPAHNMVAPPQPLQLAQQCLALAGACAAVPLGSCTSVTVSCLCPSDTAVPISHRAREERAGQCGTFQHCPQRHRPQGTAPGSGHSHGLSWGTTHPPAPTGMGMGTGTGSCRTG